MALTDKLSAIGAAIREKTGKTELLTLDAMPGEIASITGGGGGCEPPEKALVFSGFNGKYRFAYGVWDWFHEAYYDKFVFEKDFYDCSYMFFKSANLTSIPFSIVFTGNGNLPNLQSMFEDCINLTHIADIYNNRDSNQMNYMNRIFYNCYKLRYAPDITGIVVQQASTRAAEIFYGCHSLRELPTWISDVYSTITNNSTSISNTYCLYNGFTSYCVSLDGISNLEVYPGTMNNNCFSNSFVQNCRLNKLTFKKVLNSPITVKWRSQTIDLTSAGWATDSTRKNWILNENSGITADKEVTDDATYQALKDNPDWFSSNVSYSRYNHDSAVETIDSLPDTSAYLAGTSYANTIKFTGAAGSKTDGGAINTLTSAEIAKATAKGWTVSLV